MKINVSGHQITIESSRTAKELQLVGKQNPAALRLVDPETKAQLYYVGYKPGACGCVDGMGIVYNTETRAKEGEKPKAALYIQDKDIPGTVEEAQKYVADVYGAWISNAQAIEDSLGDAVEAATAFYAKLAAAVTVEN